MKSWIGTGPLSSSVKVVSGLIIDERIANLIKEHQPNRPDHTRRASAIIAKEIVGTTYNIISTFQSPT